jgi:hypothetical protein
MLFKIIVFLFAYTALAFESSSNFEDKRPPPSCQPEIQDCTPQRSLEVAKGNSFWFGYLAANYIDALVTKYEFTPVAYVDPNYCFIPGCCTRFMTVHDYGNEVYRGKNVAFPEPYQATFNPDGTIKVTAVEIVSSLGTIISVHSVFWIWKLTNDAACGHSSGCNMELLQFQSSDYTCQFGAPPCGDCYTGNN